MHNLSFFPTGRRIVNIGNLFKTLFNQKHHELFKCSFTNMQITNELRLGFRSIFTLECKVCKIKLQLDTNESENEKLDINTAAVTGIVSTGSGWTQLSEIAAVLDIPAMSSDMFQKCQATVFEAVKETAWLSMQEAGQEEARLARENGDIDTDGTPLITVIADGAWSKRSYRVNYNAPLGMLVEKIHRDDKFWEINMADKLKKFYFDCLLPEIIDPRHSKNLPIRNPAYRTKL